MATHFEELWETLSKKIVKLQNPEEMIHICPEGLKQLLEQFYDLGFKRANDLRDWTEDIARKFPDRQGLKHFRDSFSG